MSSENGWEPAKASSDQCEWVVVPGTNPEVHLQILKGWPLQIMRAYAADYHAFVEPLRDADSASWTPTNSVATSNHLNGTAMDLNWDSHPFRVADAGYTPEMIGTMNELLEFYEDTMFWANNWKSPKDAMHHQMGYDSFNNVHTADFIKRKIRADGFSTFRRGGTAAPAPSPPMLSQSDRYALAVITEGQKRGISPRGIQIALAVTLVESNLTMYANSNVPESMNFPHEKVGRDHDSTGLFQQRQAWGPLSCTMDAACSAGLFFEGGKSGQRGLTDFDYNNAATSPGTYAQRVQVSAFPDRYDRRMAEAVGLYNRLTTIPGGIPAPPPSPGEDDFLMGLSDQEQRDLYNEIMAPRVSRSPLRSLGQGPLGDSGEAWWNVDGSLHLLLIMELAKLKYPPPWVLTLLHEIAAGDPVQYPDRAYDIKLAQAILADLGSTTAPTPPPAPAPAPAAAAVVVRAPEPVEPEPEVLPAVYTDQYTAPGSITAQDLIDTVKKLKIFDTDYRREFDNLTKGSEE